MAKLALPVVMASLDETACPVEREKMLALLPPETMVTTDLRN